MEGLYLVHNDIGRQNSKDELKDRPWTQTRPLPKNYSKVDHSFKKKKPSTFNDFRRGF